MVVCVYVVEPSASLLGPDGFRQVDFGEFFRDAARRVGRAGSFLTFSIELGPDGLRQFVAVMDCVVLFLSLSLLMCFRFFVFPCVSVCVDDVIGPDGLDHVVDFVNVCVWPYRHAAN